MVVVLLIHHISLPRRGREPAVFIQLLFVSLL